jgi:prepilin-type N-terminal cleavage/methylation domain-containing protein
MEYKGFKKILKRKSSQGMTLIELLVVVSIVTFLVIAVVVFLRAQIFKANDARRKAEIKRIGIAVEEYEKDNNCYPLTVVCNPGTGLLPYIDKIPCDPVSNLSYYYEYEDSTCPKWFRIYTHLENESDKDYIANIGPNSAFNFLYASSNAPEVTPGVAATSTPLSSGGGEVPINLYGCFSGVCTPIYWNPVIQLPECLPSYGNSSCYGQCVDADTGLPKNECIIQ